jgi:transposase, IS30 family
MMLPARMEDATAASALAGFTFRLNSIAAPMHRSITCAQGKEMSRHQQPGLNTGVRVYFCAPHSPWQRDTRENTNGLLRQHMPKGTGLSVYSQEGLDVIADSLDKRPRTTQDFSLLAALSPMLAMAHQAPSSVQ